MEQRTAVEVREAVKKNPGRGKGREIVGFGGENG